MTLSRTWVRPRRLRLGDRIAIVAPSGPVDRALVAGGARRLEEAGFRVVLGRRLFSRRGHLAGSDRDRLADLNRALRDPAIRAIVMARGGYGAMRLVPGVDWKAMRRDPKVFAGFSDGSFLHAGFASASGVRTLHGPNVQGFGKASRRDAARWLAWATEPRPDLPWRTLQGRERLAGPAAAVRGRVLGGNLVLVHFAAMAGLLPSLRGAILFLEEVNEPSYRVDSLLVALRQAGCLRGLRGVALGGFTRYAPPKEWREALPRGVLLDHLGALGVPVVSGFAAGHGRANAPFPLGARATLDPRRRTLVFEEGLVC
ncbi:MAG TPA: LD-carboxypeptidase [Candidatus Thermoplasmatota archaeon]